MTPKTLTAEQELAYHVWWMSSEVPGSSTVSDDPNVINNAEEMGRAAFIEGWLCGEGSTIDGAVTPLMEALKVLGHGADSGCSIEDCVGCAALLAAVEATR